MATLQDVYENIGKDLNVIQIKARVDNFLQVEDEQYQALHQRLLIKRTELGVAEIDYQVAGNAMCSHIGRRRASNEAIITRMAIDSHADIDHKWVALKEVKTEKLVVVDAIRTSIAAIDEEIARISTPIVENLVAFQRLLRNAHDRENNTATAVLETADGNPQTRRQAERESNINARFKAADDIAARARIRRDVDDHYLYGKLQIKLVRTYLRITGGDLTMRTINSIRTRYPDIFPMPEEATDA